MADLIIAVFVNAGSLSHRDKIEYAAKIGKNLREKMDDQRVDFYVFPSDHDDIKAIPVKCYLEGNCPNTPDSLEELIEELKSLLSEK